MKIGVFDSGVGGLTVLKALRDKYPEIDFVYLGDTARVPYGNKSAQTVIRYSLEGAEFLLSEGVEMIIIACNTASSYALDVLRENFSIPVFGVIEPGVKHALDTTKNRRVGVIGTKATVSSDAYGRLLRSKGIEVFQKACPLFVPLVEEGILNGDIAQRVVEYYLTELKDKDIDTLILACTHYPLLRTVIEKFMGESVKVIDSAESTALEIMPFVERSGFSSLSLYFTDHSPSLNFLIELILGEPIDYKLLTLPCKV
ncbi:glutamate racemase [Pampinifervens florentissimum]|uniref:glutamate racemase n=1 Tax=Pampinifervens florentissimum TaxID=1632019 RepID=UPI0013B49A46|nr:glutamate racemase [Hydrogenobacter sp. T-8]QID34141.1 glutamate racemase [Hydrogenobacter sp. T-8]